MAAPAADWMPELDAAWERRHRVHDVVDLTRRWRAVARAARMQCGTVADAGGFPILCLRSRGLGDGGLYLSSGVHGDEPAAAQGLLVWAEANTARLRQGNVMIYPLINPAGLSRNTRADEAGRDLNRSFHEQEDLFFRAWRQSLGSLKFALTVCLHEDYDAQGTYGYELNRNLRLKRLDPFLAATEALIPRDSRGTIEGSRARGGVIRRKRVPQLEGQPEAIALYQEFTACTVTLETPSEFSLALRTRTHARWVEEAWRLTHGGP